MEKTYILEHLGCANCAAKIEERINKLPEVESAVIIFATKQLRVRAADPDALLPRMEQIANSLEPEIRIVEREGASPRDGGHSCGEEGCRDHEHHHEEDCGCGHEHHHGETEEHSHGGGGRKKTEWMTLIAGAVLFVMALLAGRFAGTWWALPVYVLAYLLLGGEILMTAGKNLLHGQVLDENFLMSLATLGAFAIGDFPEAVGVMLFYRVGEYFEHTAVERSRGQIMDAVDLRPERVNLVDGDGIRVIPARDAKAGDVVLVRPGDRIPLDGMVVSGQSRLDTSPITGEPVPVSVEPGRAVTSGCVNLSGQLKIRVEKPLSESMVTRILNSVENAAASKPQIQRFITRFARIYTPVVVALAVLVAVGLPFLLPDWHFFVDPAYTGAESVLRAASGTASVFTALTFLVMSCPCALVLSVPLAFFCGIGAGSKKGILFKGGVTMEALDKIRTVVMDKTGTVTEGNFVLQQVKTFGGMEENELLALCAGCEQTSTHPIAASIVSAARERGLELPGTQELEELPGMGLKAACGGHRVLCGNQKLMERFGIAVPELEELGYGAEVLAAVDGEFAGYMVISDTIKPGAAEALAGLREQGIRTAMLTGDTEKSAAAVAKKLGIDEVHARLLPEDKLTRLRQIREKTGSVLFVGDGINDAPVLAGADVGAAMGSGADAAIEAADVVFMTSSVEAIPQAVRIAKRTKAIAWQNVAFALAVKAAVMALGLMGYASMWMAVFADSGVAMLCVLNSIRILYGQKKTQA